MSEQDSISISAAACASPSGVDTARAILYEVLHALQKLIDSGESTQIDLRGQPFGPGELERLLDWLGRGEVAATIEAMGPTRVWESALSGVWLIDHRNSDDERLTLQIEVARCPQILRSPSVDLQEAVASLEVYLGGTPGEAG